MAFQESFNMAYIVRSPWNPAGDIGNTFANLMLGMAQLKAAENNRADLSQYRHAQQQLEVDKAQLHNAMQQALFQQRTPLIEAQTGAQQAVAGLNNARAETQVRQQNAAQDAGLAAFFDTLNSGGLPVNPTTGGQFAATPENIQLLTRALSKQALREAGALNPQGAASMVRPIEANKDTSIIDPITRALIGSGPVSPEAGFTLAPQEQRFDAKGKPVAENKNVRPTAAGNDGEPTFANLVAALNGAQSMVAKLGTDEAGLGAPYQTNPALGESFTNSAAMVNLLSGLIQNRLAGRTNAPVTAPQGGGTNAPKAGSVHDVQQGQVYNGYRYKGGPKDQQSSWEKVQ